MGKGISNDELLQQSPSTFPELIGLEPFVASPAEEQKALCAELLRSDKSGLACHKRQPLATRLNLAVLLVTANVASHPNG